MIKLSNIEPKAVLTNLRKYIQANMIPTFSKFDSERQYWQGKKDGIEEVIKLIEKMEKGLG